MSTELVTWIMFVVTAVQYYYIMCAFFERTIKNFWIGSMVQVTVELSLRSVSSLVEGNAYWIGAAGVVIMQLVILIPLFHRVKWYCVCGVGFIVMMSMIFSQFPVLWMVELITGTNVVGDVNGGDFNLTYVIVSTLNCMFYMVIIVMIYAIKFRIKYKSSKMLLVSTSLIVLYQMMVILFFYGLCWKNGDSAVDGGVIFAAISILTDMIIIIRMEDLLKKIQVEKEWNRLSAQRRLEYQYYHKVQEDIEKMRLERHDYINYIQSLEQMIVQQSQYCEAQKLILEIKDMYDCKEA